MIDIYWVFLLIGLFEGLVLTILRIDIFDFNTELEYNTIAYKQGEMFQGSEIVKYLQDKRMIKLPTTKKVWIFLSITTGTILGWSLTWFLFFRVDILTKSDVSWEDLAILLLAYIGISGRLHTIAESVQDWFKRS